MDILFYTEVDNRELDAACLVKHEMERRGYKVKVQRYNRICESGNHTLYKPTMLILPWLYNDEFLFNFINNNNMGKLKIVNLQSEQILSENFIKNNYHMPKENCIYGHHLAWGQVTKERFIGAGIPEENIITIGNINIDFNSEKLINVYADKEEIAKDFSLDFSKEWVLFISSFTHPSMTEEERSSYLRRFPFLKDFIDIATESQKTLIKWFERFVSDNPDKEFIYRPHPIELKNDTLLKLAEKYSNFHVISQLSIRQWVRVCEHNTTWFSTSIADVYYQKKDCAILRPLAIPRNADCELFYDCNAISDYDSFLNFIKRSGESKFPIVAQQFEKYYGTNECGENYIIFCDQLERILKSRSTMPTINVKASFISRIRRNSVSFIFYLNNIFNLSKLPFLKPNSHMSQQLKEKYNSHKRFVRYTSDLLRKLKDLI